MKKYVLILFSSHHNDGEGSFDDVEQAKSAGREYLIRGQAYKFQVVDIDTKEVVFEQSNF
jgi:regulatory protein YycI of two-component signal transduction system YycFG